MIDLNKVKHIYVYPGPTDMRLGIYGLRTLILSSEERIEPNSLYVFCGSERKCIKIIEVTEGSIWLYQNKLIKGKFVWPNLRRREKVSREELMAIILGVSLVKSIENRGKCFASY